jgi:hypothetical protein
LPTIGGEIVAMIKYLAFCVELYKDSLENFAVVASA